MGPPSPGDIPAPEEATPPEELLDDPDDVPLELVLPPEELPLAPAPLLELDESSPLGASAEPSAPSP